MCGNCKNCVCVKGGYQVHLTLKYDFVPDVLDCELLEIANQCLNGKEYTEFITSKNFQDLRFAQEYMMWASVVLAKYSNQPKRFKIEASPNKNMPYLYREVHYNVTGQKVNIPNSFRSFSKDKEFATVRFFPGEEPFELHLPHRVEDVIFDSNLNLDRELCPKTKLKLATL